MPLPRAEQDVSAPDITRTTIRIATAMIMPIGWSSQNSFSISASLPIRSSAWSVSFLLIFPAPFAASFACFFAAASANSLCISFLRVFFTVADMVLSPASPASFAPFAPCTASRCSLRLWILEEYFLACPCSRTFPIPVSTAASPTFRLSVPLLSSSFLIVVFLTVAATAWFLYILLLPCFFMLRSSFASLTDSELSFFPYRILSR